MQLHTAERLELDAREDLNHALDMLLIAATPRAKARHERRVNVAADRLERARFAIRALSAEIVDSVRR